MSNKPKFRYFFAGSLIVVAALAVTVFSCEKQIFSPQTELAISDDATRSLTESGEVCGKIIEKRIMKNGETSIGEAIIYNDKEYFYVLLSTDKGYFKNAYLDVSSKFGTLPLDENGSIIIDKFNHKSPGLKPGKERKFRIPLSEMSRTSYISVAAEYVQNLNNTTQKVHISWVEGKHFGTSQPAHIFDYRKQLCSLVDSAISDEPRE